MKQQALIRGRVVDENQKPLNNVLICAHAPPYRYSKRTGGDGLFEIPIAVDKEIAIFINTPRAIPSTPTAKNWDDRPDHLQGRCSRYVQLPAKTLREGVLDWGDIVLGYPTASLPCEVVEPSGKPFTTGEIKAQMRNNGMSACILMLDSSGRARFESLDPTDLLTVTVMKDCTSESKLWTTWTFPPVKPSHKPLRLVLEDRLKQVRPRPEL